MDFLASLNPQQWLALCFSAFMVGLAKAGFDGGTLIAVPIMAACFGARSSSGLLLGILLAADVVAAWNYRKDGSFAHLLRVLPWALLGIILGVYVGGSIPDKAFRYIMAALILGSAALMAVREFGGGTWVLPGKWWAAAPLGLLAGFASMVGNAAGPVMGLYLLSSGLPKGNIVGTAVWFFFSINVAKLPFHIFSWHTFTLGSMLADLAVAPLAVIATLAGVKIIKIMPDKAYRYFLIIAAMAGGLYLGLR